MATRLGEPVKRRSTLPLTAQDESDLALIRTSPSYQRALENLAGSAEGHLQNLSESALLHAVFAAGLDAVRLAAAEAGYAQLAEERRADATARRAQSRRRRPSWADEA
jgi:hypothetical protein